jgi:large subunit ribosomal protein L24
MAARVKRNDVVEVISGKDKGRTGRVLQVFPEENMCIVEKVNVVKRHQKAKAAGQPSGIIEKSLKIHLSKVMPFDESSKKASRVKFKMEDKQKVRVFVKSGKAIEQTAKAKKA